MTSNGRRRPSRPSLEVVAPGASSEETAAIAAALEQFLHDTAPAPAALAESISPWERASLTEGVGLGGPTQWGDGISWG